MILVDLRPNGMDGARAEKVLEDVSIALNKNTCPGDKSALKPSGLRIGTPALTSRGFKEADFVQVAEFIHKGLEITKEAMQNCGPLLKDFKAKLVEDANTKAKIAALKEEVENFAIKFPMPGLSDW